MQKKLVQRPVPAAPPSFSTTPQISTTIAASCQCGQERPTPLLEGLCPACSYHDQACHSILPRGDSNAPCSASVQLETLLISPCWSLPLAEGSSCCARPTELLWSLILLPSVGVAARMYLQILFKSSFFLLLFVACPAFAQGTAP